jgi:glycosyltransferase involved in cell wall biosynthesis
MRTPVSRDRAVSADPSVIAHVVLGLQFGGLERVVVDLVNLASPLIRCSVVCLERRGPLAEEIRAPGAAVTELQRRPGFRPWLALGVRRLLLAQGANLVHTHNTTAGFYGTLGARLAGLPIIHTKHTSNPAPTASERRLDGLVYRMTDHVVAVSDAARRQAHREGAPAARLSVIDNGIDTTRFVSGPRERATARGSLGLPADAFVVGSVARLAPEKNHALLLAGFARVAVSTNGGASWLVLVGGGALEGELRARAAAMAGGDRVVFTGPRRSVESLLPAFDAFVLSSDREGLPVALLEAMATSIAPVVTRVGAMPEVVAGGLAGVIVEPGDEEGLTRALLALQNDAALRSRIAGAARARVRDRYDARRMAGDYEAIYGHLLGRDLRAAGMR